MQEDTGTVDLNDYCFQENMPCIILIREAKGHLCFAGLDIMMRSIAYLLWIYLVEMVKGIFILL